MHVDFSMKAFQPDFEFGEGRSYSRFSYGALTVSKKKLGDNESIDVQISVKNTSQREGKEVVQLYYDDLFASITPAVKKLVRYQKIHLKPSEEKIVRFELSKEDFSFISKDLKRITEEGDIILMCKDKKQKIEIR
jgi:beta-glucosidase